MVIEEHCSEIKARLRDCQFSLIVDESPELGGQPAINILAVFYCEKDSSNKILLLSSSALNQCNAASVLLLVQQTVCVYNMQWTNCVGILSDSAKYMQWLAKDLQALYPNVLHIPCIAHLVNVAVNTAVT
ncbi:UNVERIFIED_CONTAM: hypothetical protein FKN15_055668 [Acipenser sinensis]